MTIWTIVWLLAFIVLPLLVTYKIRVSNTKDTGFFYLLLMIVVFLVLGNIYSYGCQWQGATSGIDSNCETITLSLLATTIAAVSNMVMIRKKNFEKNSLTQKLFLAVYVLNALVILILFLTDGFFVY